MSRRYQISEMHARLNAQDRQYHNNSQFIAENSLLRTDPTVQENPVAFSNEKYLLDVIKRKPISREVTNAIKDPALAYANGMIPYEPNPQVRAEFGYQHAMYDLRLGVPFGDYGTPDNYVDGKAFKAFNQEANHKFIYRPYEDDISLSVENKQFLKNNKIPALDPIFANKVLNSNIRLPVDQTFITADCIRPPLEAFYLISSVIKNILGDFPDSISNTYEDVLLIGCGYTGPAQILSVINPSLRVFPFVTPYCQKDTEPIPRKWTATILNVPTFPSWLNATHFVHGNPLLPYLKAKALLKNVPDLIDHVLPLVSIAVRHRVSGSIFVLIGDPIQYHAAIDILNTQDLIIPLIINNKPAPAVWIDYNRPQWSPFNLPAPTGKLISCWLWK